jgi:hypothetical protein
VCAVNVCVVDWVGKGSSKILGRLLKARHIVEFKCVRAWYGVRVRGKYRRSRGVMLVPQKIKQLMANGRYDDEPTTL